LYNSDNFLSPATVITKHKNSTVQHGTVNFLLVCASQNRAHASVGKEIC